MTQPDQPKPAPVPHEPEDFPGDRIAKVMSRTGVASRRDAERMIAEGRVTVNGQPVDSPALNVGPKDRIAVDGADIGRPEPVRMWLYHKPLGVVTSAKDEEGRTTVFEDLPDGLPYVMTVGRLDINSEGLLLLTNDGEIKRRLELPTTGWLRRYRVRVNGEPSGEQIMQMRGGVTIEGIIYQPMEVVFDRQQGANAWMTVGIREGKNREIRRVMEFVGLQVNRLIRISYGPFQLGELEPGAVQEMRPRILRDLLGLDHTPDTQTMVSAPARSTLTGGRKTAGGVAVAVKPRNLSEDREENAPAARKSGPGRKGAAEKAPKSWGSKSADAGDRRPRPAREDGDSPRKSFGARSEGDRKPYGPRGDGDRKPYGPRGDGDRKPYARAEGDAPRKSYGPRPDGDRKPYAPRGDGPRSDGPRKPYGARAEGDAPRKSYGPRPDGDRKPYAPRGDGPRSDGPRKPYGARAEGDAPRKSYGPRPDGDRKPYAPRGDGPRSDGPRKPYGVRAEGDAPRKSYGPRPDGDRKPYAPRGDGPRKPYGARAEGDAPRKSYGPRPDGDRKPYAPRGEGPRSDGPRKPYAPRAEGGFKPGAKFGARPGGPRPGPKPGGRPAGKPGPKRGPGKG